MQTPVNTFKQALRQGPPQFGLWLDLADGLSTELLAGIGYDWLVIDGEHGPNDLRSVLSQLQAIGSARASLAGVGTQAIVRLPQGDTALIKQYLELGAQTLLIPMVDTAEQADQWARAMRYPPQGVRGMGSFMARSSRWQGYPDYAREANDQMCLLVQVETVQALQNLDAIAATPDVDGVFLGPYDLSFSMGFPGQPDHPEVLAALEDAVARIRKAGKAPGILATDEERARHWLQAGVRFIGVGLDAVLLANAARSLLARYKPGPKTA